jgi:hypothetical protein
MGEIRLLQGVDLTMITGGRSSDEKPQIKNEMAGKGGF